MNLLNWKNIKIGTKVLVSNNGEEWYNGVFIEYISDGLRPFSVETQELGLSLYKYCKLECMIDYDYNTESDEDIKFLYKIFGYLGKKNFKQFVDIISECDGRISSLSNCNLKCYECIFNRLLEYEKTL